MMNIGNNLMSFLEGMASPTASPLVSGFSQQTSVDPTGSQNFANLLDLVSDLEMAESQGLSKNVDMEAELGKLLSPEKEKLEFDSNEGQLSRLLIETQGFQGIPNVHVGQDIVSPAQFKGAEQTRLETSSVSDLLLKGQELQAISTVEIAQKLDSRHSKIDLESLSQWSAALASGDMNGVHVEGDLAASVADRIQSINSKNDSRSELSLLKEASGSSESDISLSSFEALASPLSAKTKINEQSSAQGNHLNHRHNEKQAQGQSFSSSMDSKSSLVEKDKLGFQSLSDSKFEASTTKNGSDFLLENSISSNSLTAATPIPSSALGLRLQQGVVSSRASLGELNDGRISPQNLDFVAEKISNLKSQGGGNLRIDLAPNHMGAIEIRVGMKNGVLNVELKAEQLSTQNSLDASKSELLGKLEKLGPAQVQVASASSHSTVSMSDKLPQSAHSEAFLNSRNGQTSVASNSAQAQNLQMNSQGLDRSALLNTPSSSDKGSIWTESTRGNSSASQSDNTWGRDERREQARNRWEENFSQRKTA